eukprot:jgi/Mesvir1/24013/Mv10759-RA.1
MVRYGNSVGGQPVAMNSAGELYGVHASMGKEQAYPMREMSAAGAVGDASQREAYGLSVSKETISLRDSMNRGGTSGIDSHRMLGHENKQRRCRWDGERGRKRLEYLVSQVRAHLPMCNETKQKVCNAWRHICNNIRNEPEFEGTAVDFDAARKAFSATYEKWLAESDEDVRRGSASSDDYPSIIQDFQYIYREEQKYHVKFGRASAEAEPSRLLMLESSPSPAPRDTPGSAPAGLAQPIARRAVEPQTKRPLASTPTISGAEDPYAPPLRKRRDTTASIYHEGLQLSLPMTVSTPSIPGGARASSTRDCAAGHTGALMVEPVERGRVSAVVDEHVKCLLATVHAQQAATERLTHQVMEGVAASAQQSAAGSASLHQMVSLFKGMAESMMLATQRHAEVVRLPAQDTQLALPPPLPAPMVPETAPALGSRPQGAMLPGLTTSTATGTKPSVASSEDVEASGVVAPVAGVAVASGPSEGAVQAGTSAGGLGAASSQGPAAASRSGPFPFTGGCTGTMCAPLSSSGADLAREERLRRLALDERHLTLKEERWRADREERAAARDESRKLLVVLRQQQQVTKRLADKLVEGAESARQQHEAALAVMNGLAGLLRSMLPGGNVAGGVGTALPST